MGRILSDAALASTLTRSGYYCNWFTKPEDHVPRSVTIPDPSLLTLRIYESLYFANARFLEDYLSDRVASECPIKHVVLMCSAINEIDLSALESLETINHRLGEMGVNLHLS